MNPYQDKPAHQFWGKAMAWPAPGHIDPMAAGAKFQLNTSDTVATLGSCFAQHISRELVRQGVAFVNAETAPAGMPLEQQQAAHYGVFSARYGNVYTVRQALQLVQRAFGDLSVADPLVWPLNANPKRFADAFRPAIEPSGFASVDDALTARASHLVAVRNMLQTASVLVFTLGLTEGWRHKATGCMLPLAPGVVAGHYNEAEYEFVNFTVQQVMDDLKALITRVHAINPALKWVLTVSPVPLVATYEKRHVLMSNTYSKSVLRVAAGEVSSQFKQVDYFPSYEVITAPDLWGRYLEDDMRSVRPEGVAHVMRVFNKHFLHKTVLDSATASGPDPLAAVDYSNVVCEEDLITESLKKSGY